MADVINLKSGERVDNTDSSVDDTIDKLVAARLDDNDTFNKAISMHLIYEFVDKDGNSQWGTFTSSNMKYTDLLWMIKKYEYHLMTGGD